MSPDYSKEWTKKAEADRTAARRAFQDARRRADQAEIACFHAQQCVEKYLKAILALRGRTIPRVHDLLALARFLKKFRFPYALLETDLRSLNQYAVEIRYPGAFATITEARKALRAMEHVIRKTRRLLGP